MPSIPLKVYVEIAVGFFFTMILIWFLAFRFVFIALLQLQLVPPNISFIISVLGSILFCSLLVKPTFKKIMKNPDIPFSVVARNPNLEIPYQPITIKSIFYRSIAAIVFSILLSLPFTIIALLRFCEQNVRDINIFIESFMKYKYPYIFIAISVMYLVFLVFPSLRKWHWTKHQFNF